MGLTLCGRARCRRAEGFDGRDGNMSNSAEVAAKKGVGGDDKGIVELPDSSIALTRVLSLRVDCAPSIRKNLLV